MDEKKLKEKYQNRRIIFFDGVCNLCNATVDFLIQKDASKELLFAPLQGVVAKILLSESQRDLDGLAFYDRGRVSKKEKAVIEIGLKLKGFWYNLALLGKFLPNFFSSFLYKLLARYRYKLFGKRETCRVPTQTEANRLLP